ncbi:S-adenosylmethionine/S-adenosylhomocysteine transporter [Kingella potus]|uniref:S-adenosylmethionine/S-adenosylhomocysteine transporter n=1 Tax=Kingella potus TaxID=265175 RepID=A0A377QZF9_9NEIS|nr:EamA family transporter [Kingella potus]UOP00973.1 EamA family transporter [Kingella potus]STR00633.1 S-adenosylmethionine/S-adenosylhomocysteine transporter [Kingella potus]
MLYQILALLVWSSAFIAAKYAETMADPAMTVQMRLIVAALIVLPACRRHIGRIPKDKWKPLLWLSFLNYVGVLMLQFIGLKYTSASSAVTVIGLEPLLMVFIGHFFFRDKAQWFHWLCGAAAFAGVALLILGGGTEGRISLFGCLLVFCGGIVFCSITRPTQRLIAQIGAPAYTSVSLAASALLCLPFTLLLAESYTVDWNLRGTAAVLYLGAGCSWLAYLLWNKGMLSMPANITGVLLSLEPVFGVLLAVLVLGEHITPLSWLGIAVVVAATFCPGALPQISAKKRQTV